MSKKDTINQKPNRSGDMLALKIASAVFNASSAAAIVNYAAGRNWLLCVSVAASLWAIKACRQWDEAVHVNYENLNETVDRLNVRANKEEVSEAHSWIAENITMISEKINVNPPKLMRYKKGNGSYACIYNIIVLPQIFSPDHENRPEYLYLDEKERLSGILAHELSHYKHKDSTLSYAGVSFLAKKMVGSALVLSCVLALFNHHEWYKPFAICGFMLLRRSVLNVMKRPIEMRADRETAQLGFGDGYIAQLEEFNRSEQKILSKVPIVAPLLKRMVHIEYFIHSHPHPLTRIAAIKKCQAEMKKSGNHPKLNI